MCVCLFACEGVSVSVNVSVFECVCMCVCLFACEGVCVCLRVSMLSVIVCVFVCV